MKISTIYDCSIFDLPRFVFGKGSITAINSFKEIPFQIHRVYYVYDMPGGAIRGKPAHCHLQQMIVAVSGSFDVTVDDGNIKRTFHLSRPYIGLYLPPGLWRGMDNFSSGSVCLVLASDLYNEADYIRTYKGFLGYKKSQKSVFI